jgi:hypothetical protein
MHAEVGAPAHDVPRVHALLVVDRLPAARAAVIRARRRREQDVEHAARHGIARLQVLEVGAEVAHAG